MHPIRLTRYSEPKKSLKIILKLSLTWYIPFVNIIKRVGEQSNSTKQIFDN